MLVPVQDPYANAYFRQWQHPSKLPKAERLLGRGGWVGTRNYELVSRLLRSPRLLSPHHRDALTQAMDAGTCDGHLELPAFQLCDQAEC